MDRHDGCVPRGGAHHLPLCLIFAWMMLVHAKRATKACLTSRQHLGLQGSSCSLESGTINDETHRTKIEGVITTRRLKNKKRNSNLVQLEVEDSQTKKNMADGIKEEKKKTQKLCVQPFHHCLCKRQKKRRSRISADKRLSWRRSKKVDCPYVIIECASLSVTCSSAVALCQCVTNQPWLAKAREWLGVPYFMVMGTDWAL